MKNLIAELLVNLAEKEQESKELVAHVEALEIVLTAMLRHMAQSEQTLIMNQIEEALVDARTRSGVGDDDTELLHHHIEKLLRYPRI